MNKKFIKIGSFVALLAFPSVAFAANKTLKDIVKVIFDYLNIAIYLIIALAFVTFVWNVYRYFFTEKDKKEAGMYVLYSTIGFFVILSLWGLVAIISNSLDLPNNKAGFPFVGSGGGTQKSGVFLTPGTNTGYDPKTGTGSNSVDDTYE